MKNFLLTFLSVCLFLSFVSCGKMKEAKDAMDAAKQLYDASEEMSKNVDLSEKKLEERRVKGDTLPLPKDDLLAYLPNSISGYKNLEPETTYFDMGGFAYSNAKVKFEDDNYNRITIEITDFNQAYALLSAAAFWSVTNIEFETNSMLEKTFKTDNDYVYGYEKYYKDSKEASVQYIIGYRFLLSLEAGEQNGTENLKDIAKKINIKKLASL